jgi:hypothetical protein
VRRRWGFPFSRRFGVSRRRGSLRHRVQKPPAVPCGQLRRAVRDAAQHVVQPILIGLGEIGQDVSRHAILVARMPDPEAHAAIGLPDMLVDGAQPVVTGMPAALFHAHLAWCQVQFVMEYRHVTGRQLVEPHRLADRLAGQVHEGLGLQQKHLLGPELALAQRALKFPAKRGKPVIGRDAIKGHPADIVAVRGVFRAWIPKPDPELHGVSSVPLGDASAWRVCQGSPGHVRLRISPAAREPR